MIAVLTNEGALEFGRAISGGSRFLAWEAALIAEPLGEDVQTIVGKTHEDIDIANGKALGYSILKTIECTGALPVEVSYGDTTKIMAVDFDFNGAAVDASGNTESIAYQSVIALARRFSEYHAVSNGTVYHIGDHVWSSGRDYAYVCKTDNFEYNGVPPENDTDNWTPVETSGLVRFPGDENYYSDSTCDVIPFFITSYDAPVTMANAMEWEYKIRVFLDNIVTAQLPKLAYFAKGGLEVNGSMMLTFLASISEQFRAIRAQITTAS